MAQYFVEWELPEGMNGFAYFRMQAITEWLWNHNANANYWREPAATEPVNNPDSKYCDAVLIHSTRSTGHAVVELTTTDSNGRTGAT